MMTWDELNRDFNKRRPAGTPIDSAFLFKKPWGGESYGNKSINDLLREFLNENRIQYIQTYNGDIWFLFRGNWTKCDWEYNNGEVSFYIQEYIWN